MRKNTYSLFTNLNNKTTYQKNQFKSLETTYSHDKFKVPIIQSKFEEVYNFNRIIILYFYNLAKCTCVAASNQYITITIC